MNSKIDSKNFLSLWEGIWGNLNPEWSAKFLTDSRVHKILTFPDSSIKLAILNHKKLDEIILYLEEHSPKFQASSKPASSKKQRLSKRKQNIPANSKEKSDYKKIYEWLIQMSEAQFDPESTFSRLIIKSNSETCESKVTYISHKDAVLALINLGERKGELIKQLPYKCNVCRKFHNTHLISREMIKKLLRKYKELLRI